MNRAYYSNSIKDFIEDSSNSILGELTKNYSNRTLVELQRNAWVEQIKILKAQLLGFEGKIYFEFSIPRMGKRVDNILIIGNTVFVIEFKVGEKRYNKDAIEQVIDYTMDLKNFHEGSHNVQLIPILIVTNAEEEIISNKNISLYENVIKANKNNFKRIMSEFIDLSRDKVDISCWENSIYKPTPTIVEAAQALYKGHNVKEITRSDSGAINLSKTADCINAIIKNSKTNNLKSICFVTGVPGAGKTLAGLNIAVERMKTDEDEHAVFLSGNGPLVEVLREALTRDAVQTSKQKGEKLTKKQAGIKANAFIQNIHHFRDDNLISEKAPIEKVVVFDEAQRAWTKEQVSSFMKRKKGIQNFDMSEPEFLIDVIDRHEDWCTIVCLIGGGQEINTGEAGLEEWINSLKNNFPEWNIHYSNIILENNNYLKTENIKEWLFDNGQNEKNLHLAISLRSFRSEKVSDFVHETLNINSNLSIKLLEEIKNNYPIVLTRDIEKAKKWLKNQVKGTERIGLLSSSGARRLRAIGIDVKNEISAPNWFLNKNDDIRSSNFLEEVATEFDIQGLEIDWACIAWGADFYIDNKSWNFQNFKGTKWQNINKKITREYLKNTYRVLLTRARQGMVIFIPHGSEVDHTRLSKFYDETFEYLNSIGIKTLS
jgi:schlafen family protein